MKTSLGTHRSARLALASLALLWLAACDAREPGVTNPQPPPPPPPEAPVADAVTSATSASFGEPLPGLTAADLARFSAGKTEFETAETIADGLGPVFNEAAC